MKQRRKRNITRIRITQFCFIWQTILFILASPRPSSPPPPPPLASSLCSLPQSLAYRSLASPPPQRPQPSSAPFISPLSVSLARVDEHRIAPTIKRCLYWPPASNPLYGAWPLYCHRRDHRQHNGLSTGDWHYDWSIAHPHQRRLSRRRRRHDNEAAAPLPQRTTTKGECCCYIAELQAVESSWTLSGAATTVAATAAAASVPPLAVKQ